MKSVLARNSPLLSSSQNQLVEYMLMGQPDSVVDNKIEAVRQSFCDAYDQKPASERKSHITVANFLANESMEETLIRYIHRICSQHQSFTVTLNNYSGFPQHTIYIRVQDTEPFKQLAIRLKAIDQYVQANGFPEATLVYRPHVAVAGGLGSDVYFKAMQDFSQRTFHESFQLNELILFKRKNQFEDCRQVNVFRFYPPDTHMHHEVAWQLKQ